MPSGTPTGLAQMKIKKAAKTESKYKKVKLIGEEEILGKKLTGCKSWRWVAGMLTLEGYRLIRVGDKPGQWIACSRQGTVSNNYKPTLPDLDDYSTVGCLLALVREVWDDPGLGCFASHRKDGKWHIYAGKELNAQSNAYLYTTDHPTEADALAYALTVADRSKVTKEPTTGELP